MAELKPVVVTTSVDDESAARKIAEHVLVQRLAACVHIHAQMTSLYWWKEELASAGEYLLTMKSDRTLFEQLAAAVRAVHPYEVPELVATDIVAIDKAYGEWLAEELGHG